MIDAANSLTDLVARARGLLFDLDETLIVERAACEAAVVAVCSSAAKCRAGLDVELMATHVFAVAGERWRALPTIEFARSVGISSWEGLWATFDGDLPGLQALRKLRDEYQRGVWEAVLARQRAVDTNLARRLAAQFPVERRRRLSVFADVPATLASLAARGIAMAVVTNGAPDTQQLKITDLKLDRFFSTVRISGAEGVGKPDQRLWTLAADDVGGVGSDLVAIGDSPTRDIGPANELGMVTVLVDRDSSQRGVAKIGERAFRISDLRQLL